MSDPHVTEPDPVSVTLPLPPSFLTTVAMVATITETRPPINKVTASEVTDYGRSSIGLVKLHLGPLVAQLNEDQWRAVFSAVNQVYIAKGSAPLVQVFGPADGAEAKAAADAVEAERVAE